MTITNISVVIPLYNKKGKILRAIESIDNQTVQPQEIIIIDDGSTDGSAQQVQDLQHPLVKLIRQPNQGVSAARNSGIHAATNEWIALLDADDTLLPNQIEQYQQLLLALPNAGLIATAYLLGDHSGTLKPIQLNQYQIGAKSQLLNYFHTASVSHPPVCSSACCVNRTAILEIGGFPVGIRSGEDLLTWARLAVRYPIAYSLKAGAIFWQDMAHTYQTIPNRIPDPSDPVGKGLMQLMAICPADQLPGLKKYISHWHKMRASILLRTPSQMALGEILLSLKWQPHNFKVWLYLLLALLPARTRLWAFKKMAQA